MLAALRRSCVRMQPLTLPSISASRFVAAAFVGSSILLVLFVVSNVSRVPVHDEFSNLPFLFSKTPAAWSAYWAQHNEHRIPLPRLLYVNAVRLSGSDFRAPPMLNLLLLIAATGFLLLAVRRLRGRFAFTDAAIPLSLLTIGQYGNLLWGFQIQFIASTAIAVTALGLALGPGLTRSRTRLGGLAVCGALLPLCGANGVALAPGIAVVLFLASAWNLREKDGSRITALVAGFAGIGILAIAALYFRGLASPPHHAEAHGTLVQALVASVNLLGMSFGPVVRLLPPQPFDGITVIGLLAVAIVGITGWRLACATLLAQTRHQALALGGVLIGFLIIAGGIAVGRAGASNVLAANRYVTLMLPVMAGSYVAWVALGRTNGSGTRQSSDGSRVTSATANWMPTLLFALVSLAAVPNGIAGLLGAREYLFAPRQIEYQIAYGIPLEFVADRTPALYPHEPRFRRDGLEVLRANAVKPFVAAQPMPSLVESNVPIRVMRTEGLSADGDGFRVTSETGHVIFALPRRQHVYGFKLTYTASAGRLERMPSMLSWEADGQPPRSGATGWINQLEPLGTPTETLVFVDHDAERLRIDVFGEGARFTIHSLVVLTRAE